MKVFHLVALLIGVWICSSLFVFAQTPTPTTQTKAPQQQTSAIMSPKCDEKKIKELAGDALVAIVKGDFGALNGFNVTLETSKMDFATLTKKMLDAGCF